MGGLDGQEVLTWNVKIREEHTKDAWLSLSEEP